ncbi:hypothetical protein M569_01952, partial [Genlisea aurea]
DMAMPRSRSGRPTSFHDPRISEPEKIEGAGSWDALEWTKVDPVSKSAHRELQEFLIEGERIVVEGCGVVLVNTDEAGTLFVTNYRLLFLSDGSRSIISLGTIPLATIEKFSKIVCKVSAPRQADRLPSLRLLQVIGKDMRIIVYGFRPRTKQRRSVYDALTSRAKLAIFWDLYAFASKPYGFISNTNPKVRLLNEYFRLLGLESHNASYRNVEDDSFALSNERWRISNVNSDYALCSTYPFALLVPKSISDSEIQQACTFRARSRLPVISWCHPRTGAVLARSSQPMVGLVMNMRSNIDEKLVAALQTQLSGTKDGRRKLYIADARPMKNALANGAMGGGSESSSNYSKSEIVFFGIDNIHTMRESLVKLRDYVDTHGNNSSDGKSSFLRPGERTWTGGNLSSMSASVATLGDSGWLMHIQNILAGSAWIAARIALESCTVLVHCSDGWDRTTQLVSLASLLLDPYYRTIKGFQALIEKDWLAFGHPFSDRLGIPTVSGIDSRPSEVHRQSSQPSFPSSPARQSSSPQTSQPTSHAQSNYSPIFLQWLDCVAQILRIYPFAFEFSSVFLVDLLDCVLSCRFGNFFCNSEKERVQAGVYDCCGCLWTYLSDLRDSDGKSHVHYNHLYDPSRLQGPLLPPPAVLAPTLWPQFHLRWSCPSEAQAGETELHLRNMAKKLSQLQKEKDAAEEKLKDNLSTLNSLSSELKREKLMNQSASDHARRATKETSSIKRALKSLGCRVRFSLDGDCFVGIDNDEIPHQRSLFSVLESQRSESGKCDEDPSIAGGGADDGGGGTFHRVCETLCPLWGGEGGCRWPDGVCAQFGSQFVGLKANFDAFDRLAIDDSYFES